jgi:hypothetical protein
MVVFQEVPTAEEVPRETYSSPLAMSAQAQDSGLAASQSSLPDDSRLLFLLDTFGPSSSCVRTKG